MVDLNFNNWTTVTIQIKLWFCEFILKGKKTWGEIGHWSYIADPLFKDNYVKSI